MKLFKVKRGYIMEEKEKLTTINKDLEIEDMQEFLLENQGIKLENLPRYEDIIQPEIKQDIKLDNLQEVNTLPFLEPKKKKIEQPQHKTIHQKRFKVAVSCFAIVGALLTGLVLVNGVSLAMLANTSKDNQKDISTLTQQVEEMQEDFDITNTNTGEAESVGYRLALPRNYPDNTADLTWFDKLSIFLMKLFG